jgi:ribose transport system substrate-binding protein
VNSRRSSAALVSAGVIASLLLAGCGNSASSPSTSGSQSSASSSGGSPSASPPASPSVSPDVSQATAAVAAAEKAPSQINETVKFPHKPPTGKTVAWLVPGLSAATDLTSAIKAAAKPLGWQIDPIAFDPGNPSTVNAAVEQAVSRHVDYIVVLTEPSSLFASGLADAKAHGIPVMEYATATEPNAAKHGIIGCFLCSGWGKLTGSLLANYVISDSQGHGDAAFIDVTEIAELHITAQTFANYLNTHCGGCKGSVIPTSLAALGAGTVGTQTVAYLQAHPSVKYVALPTDGIADNLPSLLKTAGLAGKVKIITASAPQAYLQDIAKGSMAAGLSYADEEGMWTMMYDLAGNSVGISLPAETYSQFVFRTTSNIPKPVAVWGGPPNFQQQYEALEGISS